MFQCSVNIPGHFTVCINFIEAVGSEEILGKNCKGREEQKQWAISHFGISVATKSPSRDGAVQAWQECLGALDTALHARPGGLVRVTERVRPIEGFCHDKELLYRDSAAHTAGLVSEAPAHWERTMTVPCVRAATVPYACAVDPCHDRVSLSRKSFPIAQCTVRATVH